MTVKILKTSELPPKPKRGPVHGHTISGNKSPEYKAYQNAQGRYFYDTKIKFSFTSFEQFYAAVGPKPEPKQSYSLRRIGNKGHCAPGNVRWVFSRKSK